MYGLAMGPTFSLPKARASSSTNTSSSSSSSLISSKLNLDVSAEEANVSSEVEGRGTVFFLASSAFRYLNVG